MSSEPMRDPRTDALLTPANSVLVVIDYQPNQINTVRSMDTELLVRNVVSVARLGKAYGRPIVLSTVNAAAGQGPTLAAIKDVLSDNAEIDRTQINSWEDVEFRKAVEARGRQKLILCALWIVQAGAQPISWVSLACELQRDWARRKTVPAVVDIVLTSRLLKGL